MSGRSLARRRLVFLTWDGPQQPYLKSLFLPLLRGLAAYGYAPEVLQFAWGPQVAIEAADLSTVLGPIRFAQFSVSRRFFPASYAWQLMVGAQRIAQWIRGEPDTVVIARSHITAAMALLALATGTRFEFVFDLDGSMPDERVEAGAWKPDGLLHRAFRAIEREACQRASVVITRSEAGRRRVIERTHQLDSAKVVAVPNGRDPTVFRPPTAEERAGARRELGLPGDAPVVVYAGAIAGQYVPDAMASLIRAVSQAVPDLQWLLLTAMREEADRLLGRFPDLRRRTRVEQVLPLDMPRVLGAADVALALRRSSPSQLEVCPVKVAEYLLCGLPVVATSHVGDLDELLGSSLGAHLMDGDNSDSMRRAVEWVLRCLRTPWPRREYVQHARSIGLEHFSLDRVVYRYSCALGGVGAVRRA